MEIATRTQNPQAALAQSQSFGQSFDKSGTLPRFSTTAEEIKNLEKTAEGTRKLNKLRKTAQDFEGVFLAQMFKPMFEGIKTSAPFGGGAAEGMWKSLMIDEFGKSIAKSGGIGISADILQEMLKLQEAKTQGPKLQETKLQGTTSQEVPNG